MKSLVIRFLARERGLFAGALILGAAATAMDVPLDFVLFALTLRAWRCSITTRCRSR